MNRSDASPTIGMQVLSATIHLLGPTILAHLISRTILRGNFTKGVSWPWICVLMVFIDSWLFVFASGLLILGIGLETNDGSCATGIFLCIIFYGTSKFFIYAFLCSSSLSCIRPSIIAEPHAAEGVHTVWRPAPHSRRLQCKPYVGCVMVLFGYCGIVGVLFYGRFLCLGSGMDSHKALGRVSFFGGDNGACYIGLREPVSIALLTYDLQVTLNHHVFNCSRVDTVLPTLSLPGCSFGQ